VGPEHHRDRPPGRRGGHHRRVVSYSHIVALGLATGQSPADAHLLPFAVDGLIVSGSVLLIYGSLLAHRARQERPGRPITARPVYRLPPATAQRLEAAQPPAIEAPRNELHLHFHGMNPAEVAEAIRQASEGR
jgi:hypothetical protein